MAQRGKVYLVGAGPGDPELLTLAAARALREADVILVDDLVNRAILAHARADARVVPVGKRGGSQGHRESTPQAVIEQLMLDEARAGHVVVRLKGGDPFLFGRGGEEAAHLREAGLDVGVIPGVTSGIAAPMAAGISVTHRDASPGVVFVTGHERDGPDERVHWDALAASGLTLVIYMGLSSAERIRSKLLQAGRPATTPVAAIANATLPTQRIATGTLASLLETIRAGGIESPAILVIGDVVGEAVQGLLAVKPSGAGL